MWYPIKKIKTALKCGICSVQFFLTTLWLITMAEWKPKNDIQTQLDVDK